MLVLWSLRHSTCQRREGNPNFNAALVVFTTREGRGKMNTVLRGRREHAYLESEFPAEVSASRIGLNRATEMVTSWSNF